MNNKRYIPYVVEPARRDRLPRAPRDAYDVEKLEGGDERTVLHFHPSMAPVKAAILPLVKKGKVKETAENFISSSSSAGTWNTMRCSPSASVTAVRDELGTFSSASPWTLTRWARAKTRTGPQGSPSPSANAIP